MSFDGTVRCSWCYSKGHNRNGCEERKKYIADNPDSYEAKREQTRKSRNRRCSYCSGTGHTRRTCPIMKEDRIKVANALQISRREIRHRLIAEGLGIGSLVSVVDWHNNRVGIVKEIEWKNINELQTFKFTLMSATDRTRWYCVNLERDSLKVLGPVSSHSIERGMPQEWRSGLLYDENHFFEKGQRRKPFLWGENTW